MGTPVPRIRIVAPEIALMENVTAFPMENLLFINLIAVLEPFMMAYADVPRVHVLLTLNVVQDFALGWILILVR
jgi:hypothetical protein